MEGCVDDPALFDEVVTLEASAPAIGLLGYQADLDRSSMNAEDRERVVPGIGEAGYEGVERGRPEVATTK